MIALRLEQFQYNPKEKKEAMLQQQAIEPWDKILNCSAQFAYPRAPTPIGGDGRNVVSVWGRGRAEIRGCVSGSQGQGRVWGQLLVLGGLTQMWKWG